MKILLTTIAAMFMFSSIALSEDAKKGNVTKVDDNFFVTSSTNIDFTESMIDGKFRSPTGFFLQGRKSQSLSQMVKLRSNFRNEMRNSKSAVKSIGK